MWAGRPISSIKAENSAEHRWHVCKAAWVLEEYFENKVDLLRVLKLLLLHDVMEIDAGDTYIYDEEGNETKDARETEAAERIFTMLPTDQSIETHNLRLEYERRETAESQFAWCIDRVVPLWHNVRSKGKSWKEHGTTAEQVYRLFDPIKSVSPRF